MESGSPMKITGIKSFLVHPVSSNKNWVVRKHWVLVKVETDQGVEGWGEAFTTKDRERNVAQHLSELTRYLIGKNPFKIKLLARTVFDDFADGRGAVDLYSAMSGIEQALWDVVGKSLGVPVHYLLGGPCRDKIKVYANGWSRGANTPEKMARRAEEVVKLGFNALKIYPFREAEDEKMVIEMIRVVREAVGLGIDILIDIHRRPAPLQAIRVAKKLEEFNVYWFEEPVPSENIDVLADVRRSISLPVVTGECLYTKFEFREVLEKRAADILNPDVGSCGGILELKEIAAMAEPYYVLVAPHNFNSTTMALAATLQVAAVIPNFLIAEYFVNFTETGNAISKEPFKIEDGYIKLSGKPGLGLEISEGALKDFPFREFRPKS